MSTAVLEELLQERREAPLPDGWAHAELGMLGRWGSGGTPSKARADYWENGEVPWVSPKDMKVAVIACSQQQITQAALDGTRLHLLPPDTVIFVVRGMILAHSFPVALTARPVVINQDMRSLVPHRGICPEYLYWALRGETNHLLSVVRDATHGTRRLESDALKSWPIPIAPYPEQERVVNAINRVQERLNVTIDTVRGLSSSLGIETTVRQHSPLLQAILEKAFAGELVETEADLARREGRDYESASALLERISGQPARAASAVQVEKGRAILDILLLLEAWGKPVSISALEPALVLMRNEAARQTLLKGAATPGQRRSMASEPGFVDGLDTIYQGLIANGAVRKAGRSGLELANSELLAKASKADRARAAETLQAIQTLSTLRSLPKVVAAITNERYEITV